MQAAKKTSPSYKVLPSGGRVRPGTLNEFIISKMSLPRGIRKSKLIESAIASFPEMEEDKIVATVAVCVTQTPTKKGCNVSVSYKSGPDPVYKIDSYTSPDDNGNIPKGSITRIFADGTTSEGKPGRPKIR